MAAEAAAIELIAARLRPLPAPLTPRPWYIRSGLI
jgi:hypothetical protein